jgi:large subunit ribosomal protein L7/L12
VGLFGGAPDRGEILELEARVARLEEQVARLVASLAGPPSSAAEPLAAEVPATDPYAEARLLAAQGSKIHAIKRVRDQTGMGLRQAKELVESW